MLVRKERVRVVVRAGERVRPVPRPDDGHDRELGEEEEAVVDVLAGCWLCPSRAGHCEVIHQAHVQEPAGTDGGHGVTLYLCGRCEERVALPVQGRWAVVYAVIPGSHGSEVSKLLCRSNPLRCGLSKYYYCLLILVRLLPNLPTITYVLLPCPRSIHSRYGSQYFSLHGQSSLRQHTIRNTTNLVGFWDALLGRVA